MHLRVFISLTGEFGGIMRSGRLGWRYYLVVSLMSLSGSPSDLVLTGDKLSNLKRSD